MNYVSRRKGFTLIELLVVIAIIGILSTVILTSLDNAKKKARNTQRITGVKQLLNAFNLARTSSDLPNPGAPACVSATCYEGFAGFSADPTVDAYLAPGISSKPVDPTGGTRGSGGFLYYAIMGGASPYNGQILPAGYIVEYYVEPPVSSTVCGPGYVWDSQPNYVYCVAYP